MALPDRRRNDLGLRMDPESVGYTRTLADTITETDHFARDAGGKLWHYSGGVYVPFGERTIGVKVKALLNEMGRSKSWSQHRVKEVVAYILTDAPELWERPPQERVNVLNGILDLESGQMIGHYPEFLSPVQLPVRYDPGSECPAWERFVAEVFPVDAQNLAWEVAAWLMTPNTSIQKAILALGEGANGKSVWLTALEAFLGRSNTSNLPLQKIEADRFAVSRLVGKLANICNDLPSDHLASTSTFKAITGGDPLVAEYKFKDSFDVVPYARLVFSANHPPRSGDASHAFYRRWIVVPFDRTFEPSEQRPREELDAELADPKELSGVLNKAMAYWNVLRTKGGFEESDSMKRALDEFRDTTDPLSVWLEKNTIQHADAQVSKEALRSLYFEYCEGRGIPRGSSKAFDAAVRRARPGADEKQRTWRGVSNTRCWVGFGLREEEPAGWS